MYCRPCILSDPVDTYAFTGKHSKDSGNKLDSSLKVYARKAAI